MNVYSPIHMMIIDDNRFCVKTSPSWIASQILPVGFGMMDVRDQKYRTKRGLQMACTPSNSYLDT